MLNILFLAPEFIYPPDTGGRVLIYNRVKALSARGHKVKLFLTIKHPIAKDEVEPLVSICESVQIFQRSSLRNRTVFKGLVRGLPYAVATRSIPSLQEQVAYYSNNGWADLLILELPQLLLNVPECCKGNVPIVLEQQNIEWEAIASIATSNQASLRKRYFGRTEGKRLKSFEKSQIEKTPLALMTFVTADDMEKYPFAPNVEKCVSTPGATDFFLSQKESEDFNIVFVANYGYDPNIEGAFWLLDQVLPHVLARFPKSHLYLVGKTPPRTLQHKAKELGTNVTVTGSVADVRPYYKLADAIAIPIFSGGGVKMKSIEAAAARRPIVATGFSMIGTGMKEHEHYNRADNAEEFLDAICNIFDDRMNARAMSDRCYNHFLEHLSWKARLDHWERLLFEAVEGHRGM